MLEAVGNAELDTFFTPEELPLELLSGQKYLTLLAHKVSQTVLGDRVSVMTMSLEPSEPLTQIVLQELNKAAGRKVDVTLVVDAYAFLLDSGSLSVGDPLFPTGLRQQVFARRQSALDTLNLHPSSLVAVTNMPDRPLRNPYAGRSHIKGAVVNDWLAFGGPNLHGTERIDAVVSLEDATSADWFYDLSKSIAQAGTTKVLGEEDFTVKLDPKTEILVDVGVPGQSAIFNRQLSIAQDVAESLFFTSQFVPNGSIAHALLEAYGRVTDVEVLYNSPASWGAIGGIMQKAIYMKQRLVMPESFRNGMLPSGLPAMHAKILANEGEGAIGTHNSSEAGVKFGTPEIMLYRKSPSFVKKLRALIHGQLSLQSVDDIEN